MATDYSGNVYVAGRYYNGPVVIENYTLTEGWPWSENLYMVKYDPTGKILWAKRIASAEGSINVQELVCDNGGNAYIGGGYTDSLFQMGSSTFTSSGPSAYHSYTAKFDPDGNLTWAKILDGSSNEISDIDVDPLGNLIAIGGYWDSPLAVESATLAYISYWNMFLIKYNTNGNLIWAKREDSKQFGFAGEVAFDKTGNFCMRYNSNGDFINKYDTSGNVLWTKKITDAENIQNRQLICDSKLNIYYTSDDTLHKLDASGAELYKKKLGQGNNLSTTANTQLMDIGVDYRDDVYLCGYYSYESMVVDTHTLLNSYSYQYYGPQYGRNLFLVKLDPLGSAWWLKGAAGSFDHLSNALSIDRTGNVFLAGQTSSATLSFDNKFMNSSTQFNSFIARLGSGYFTGVAENDPAVAFEIYPIPASGFLNIEWRAELKSKFTITVYNAFSQIVYSRICYPAEATMTLNLDDFSKGIYFIELKSGATTQVKKVVVN